MQQAPNPKVDQLVRTAYEAMRARRTDDAARIWEQVRTAVPDHPQALFHLGCYALFRKQPARARDLLEQAARADPNVAAIPLNLSHAYRDLDDRANELAALDRALAVDPYFFPAALAKAVLIERNGSPRAAAKLYKSALGMAPADEELTPDVLDTVRHARAVVAENAVALGKFVEAKLAEVGSRHRGTNLDRFEECKDIALGTKQVYTQKPTMLLMPWLPPIQFYDRSEFPWLPGLEGSAGAIREELLAVIDTHRDDFRPYITRPAGTGLNQWKELNNSPRWSSYFFWKDGKRFHDAHNQCPKTSALLETIPLMHAENFGPTVMFSVLAPHTHLPAHSSATNARLIVHLPLVVPENCRFRVGNDTREVREGHGWVFDDTIDHEAWNDSDQFRTILIFDIWNPFLTMAERELVTALLNGMNEYYAQ